MSNSGAINTGKTGDRRVLRFDSTAHVMRDLAALEAAHKAGTLRRSGNWTPGEIFTHLAAFINYAYDGYPPELAHPPWIIRLIVKPMKDRSVYKGMRAGVRIPGIKGGTTGFRDVPFEQAIAVLRGALARLERMPPAAPNPLFGPMTHDEWRGLQQRHAELHLSFLHVK